MNDVALFDALEQCYAFTVYKPPNLVRHSNDSVLLTANLVIGTHLGYKNTLLPVSLSCHLASIHQRALILFIQTLALYKSYTYLLTYL